MAIRFAALDTRFILALAGGEPDAEATIDYLHQNGFTPIVTESVVEQLGEFVNDPSSSPHKLAKHAQSNMVNWGLLSPPNRYVQNGTSCVLAEKILAQDLIPGGAKIEAEILVEAACQGCQLLITFSNSLLNANHNGLNLTLIDSDLVGVLIAIASPSMIENRIRLTQAASPVLV